MFFDMLQGLFTLFVAPYPNPTNSDDTERLGIHQGREIIGVFIVEIILKCLLADAGVEHNHRTHKLRELFGKLPDGYKMKIEQEYRNVINGYNVNAWSVEQFLNSLAEDPITQTRYFWEPHDMGNGDKDVVVGWLIYDTYNVVCALMTFFPTWDEEWVALPFPYYISPKELYRLSNFPHCQCNIELVGKVFFPRAPGCLPVERFYRCPDTHEVLERGPQNKRDDTR